MLEIQLQDELNCKQSGESTALYLNFEEKAEKKEKSRLSSFPN